MSTAPLASMVHAIAKPLGYRRHGRTWWRSFGELTTVVNLQSSQWGSGVYFNFGTIPTSRYVVRPPRWGYWPISFRGGTFRGPFQDQFGDLSVISDNADIDPEALQPAIEWMFQWLMDKYSNPAVAAADFLKEYPNSDGNQMYDWATAFSARTAQS